MHSIPSHPKPLTTSGLLAAAFIVVFPPQIANACLQQYGTDTHGIPSSHEGKFGKPLHSMKSRRNGKAEWQARKRELIAQLPNGDFKIRNDYAVVLIHLGQSSEALEILKNIEVEKPGQYETAANLGTAYELLGNNANALKWIEEGIKRNPDSHNGSEWVHVKILEAKLQLAADPDWLKTHSVLGLDFGSELVPKKLKESRRIQAAIKYQLHERLEFVTAPNPIVADLLGDFANLLATNDLLENAIPVYRYALEFKPARVELIERRVTHFEGLVQLNLLSGTHSHTVWLWGGSIAAAVLVYAVVFLVRFTRRRRRARYDGVRVVRE